jgi:hypothetical protein
LIELSLGWIEFCQQENLHYSAGNTGILAVHALFTLVLRKS